MKAWLGAALFLESRKRLRGFTPAAISEALSTSAPLDFGDYAAQWYASRPNPRAYISLSVHDRYGRLIE
jgi:hypothetical protein